MLLTNNVMIFYAKYGCIVSKVSEENICIGIICNVDLFSIEFVCTRLLLLLLQWNYLFYVEIFDEIVVRLVKGY